MKQNTQLINMLILAFAIILICVAKSRFSELFVPQVPLPPNNYPMPPMISSNPQAPLMYPQQIYPAKIPHYNELGRPCDSIKDCGIMGVCQEGKCNAIPYQNTTFNIQSN